MRKIMALSGISLALFIAGLIFFANSSANNASATEAEQNTDNSKTACPYFAENGTCACTANGGTCNCGKNGNGVCGGKTATTNNQGSQTKPTCGCQNNQ
ncbi:MAG TPA: hypothetical protein PK686_03605 [bacterium]|nr:hypothetical protein [bacterium]HPV65731.1 hypothetical protein [bacterium]